MNVEYYKLSSRRLGQDMEFKAYGHAGKPLIVFPSACGRFYEYEDFGMVDAIAPFIDAGRVRLYTLDSIDCEAWLAHWMYPGDRGTRHEQYEDYVIQETLPFIREHSGYQGKYMTVGICVGQGAWEEDSLRETRALEVILHNLDVPAQFNYWGLDVAHDWPWWRKQLPYFLETCI